ncbi:MAG: Na+/H+ antiporter NhaA [Deltaproteobacteria bacterium]|nr:Na+/H+ antiporter NhaA [Deltaproteobacteria bacterium]
MDPEQPPTTTTTTTTTTLDVLVRLLVRPAEVFKRVIATGGGLLVVALIAGMLWRNSSFGDTYAALWATPVVVGLGGASLQLSLLEVINDGLMAVFFLVVGAEIKYELVVGELRGARRAAVPILAAIGGMLVPALLYVVIAPAHREGFGTPMATDIAFALAAIGIVSGRVPPFVVKVLMGLAIIDDLGAIVVIALFYGGEIHAASLGVAAGCVIVLVGLNLGGVWQLSPYLLVGVPLWLALHHGGVHPTIAGVLVGLCMPARGRVGVDEIVAEARGLVALAVDEATLPDDGRADEALRGIERRLRLHAAPLEVLVRSASSLVAWFILPLFALANGGVHLQGFTLATLVQPVSLGIIIGLFIGKQAGIFATIFACVKTGLLKLPDGVTLFHFWGMSILAGVGFTMSLFVAGLAFQEGSELHNEAKAGILIGSTLSALVGVAILRLGKTTTELEPG